MKDESSSWERRAAGGGGPSAAPPCALQHSRRRPASTAPDPPCSARCKRQGRLWEGAQPLPLHEVGRRVPFEQQTAARARAAAAPAPPYARACLHPDPISTHPELCPALLKRRSPAKSARQKAVAALGLIPGLLQSLRASMDRLAVEQGGREGAVCLAKRADAGDSRLRARQQLSRPARSLPPSITAKMNLPLLLACLLLAQTGSGLAARSLSPAIPSNATQQADDRRACNPAIRPPLTASRRLAAAVGGSSLPPAPACRPCMFADREALHTRTLVAVREETGC